MNAETGENISGGASPDGLTRFHFRFSVVSGEVVAQNALGNPMPVGVAEAKLTAADGRELTGGILAPLPLSLTDLPIGPNAITAELHLTTTGNQFGPYPVLATLGETAVYESETGTLLSSDPSADGITRLAFIFNLNAPPVIVDVIVPESVECSGGIQEVVLTVQATDDQTATEDLTYFWFEEDGTPLNTVPWTSAEFSVYVEGLGAHIFKVVAVDEEGAQSPMPQVGEPGYVVINVVDETAPTFDGVVELVVLDAVSLSGVPVEDVQAAIDGVTASDACVGDVTPENDLDELAIEGHLPIGSTTVTWTADDGNGNTAMASQTVKIVVPADALTGLHKVRIRRNANVLSNIRSNGRVRIDRGHTADDPGMIQGSILTTGPVQIARFNHITGDITAGGRIRLHRTVVVEGTVEPGAEVETAHLPPVILSVDYEDARDITVRKNQSIDLPPNDETTPAYGNLNARKGSTVTLHSGVYYFERFSLAKQTSLIFDLEDGPVTVNISKRLTLGRRAVVSVNGGSASDILFNIASPQHVDSGETDDDDEGDDDDDDNNGVHRRTNSLARGVHFLGTIYAPASRIAVARDAVVEGGLLGWQVTLARDVVFVSNLAGHVDCYGSPVLTKRALVVEEEADPVEMKSFSLGQNYPNPFNPSTTISYSLGESSTVHVAVYNVLGQQIKSLVNEVQTSGDYNVVWNGEDAFGRRVASGVYFYRLVAGRHQDTRRMVFAK